MKCLDVKPALALYEQDFSNSHWTWNYKTPTMVEANLSGAGADFFGDDGHPFDKSKGLRIILQSLQDPSITEDVKIVVKSIEFIK